VAWLELVRMQSGGEEHPCRMQLEVTMVKHVHYCEIVVERCLNPTEGISSCLLLQMVT
jgi:hypothetical protein